MPRHHNHRVITDLADASGTPLTTTELAHMLGVSATFIRTEIKCGELRAVALGRGRKRMFRITATEAVSYARRIGLL